jgi:hypothetical protein
MNIIVKMKNGTTKEFLHEGRAGGSYTKTTKYEYDSFRRMPPAEIPLPRKISVLKQIYHTIF